MAFLDASDSPIFTIPGATFTGLASPSRGSIETSVWRVSLDPGTPGQPHRLTREEIFVVISGSARAAVGRELYNLTTGCTLVVAPHVEFSLTNDGPNPFEAIAVLPTGGAAVVGDGPPFTPPWAA